MKRLFSFLLALTLVVTLLPVQVLAAEEITPIAQSQELLVNPLYADILKDVVPPEIPPVLYAAEEEYATTEEEAVDLLRAGMVARQPQIVVLYQLEDYTNTLMRDLFYKAIEHTGEPTEGDYLKWQYGYVQLGTSGYTKDGMYYLTLTYTITYYSDAQQEAQMDEAVAALIDQLGLDALDEDETVKAVYDWICQNVTYDYDNLYDDTYLLKHTAYAALMHKTAVCQGYAVLLYRLLLEQGIDCRLISGNAGGPHGWNIIELNDLYYNADSTWDAGQSPEEYDWFLWGHDEYDGHTRDAEYDTPEFHAAYPMAEEDYGMPCTHPETRVENAVEATCTEDGYTGDTVCAICDELVTQGEAIPSGHSFDENSRCTRCGYTGGQCGEDLTWTLEDGVLTISGSGNMDNYRSAGAPWSAYQEQIREVVVESGVSGIGSYAFSGCSALERVTFRGDAPAIGLNAFENVTAKVSYPAGNDSYEGIQWRNYGGELTWEPVCPGHTYVSETIAPTCTDYGCIRRTCTICGHSYEEEIVEAPGHQFEGWISDYTGHWHQCTVCEEQLDFLSHEDIEEGGKCIICEYEKVHTHDMTLTEKVEPTCVDAGMERYYVCGLCENWYLDEAGTIPVEDRDALVIPALGHSFRNYENNNDADCTEDGTETAKCDRCEVTDTRTVPGSALGHRYEGWTFDETGHWHQCTVCEEQLDFVSHENIEEGGKCIICEYENLHVHSMILEEKMEPSCTTDGMESYYVCESCEEWFLDEAGTIPVEDRDALIIPALGHDYADGICTRCEEADPDSPWVERIAGTNRCQTAMEAADELLKLKGGDSFHTIIVADGDNYPDALSGSYLAAVAQAPILLVRDLQQLTVLGYIRDYLDENGIVYILGGTNSVPATFELMLDVVPETDYNVIRLAGDSRYDTSLAIIREANRLLQERGDAHPGKVLVCDGGGYADSLSASAAGLPVLLVNGKGSSLTKDQEAYLKESGNPEIYVIGGVNTVSEPIRVALSGLDADGDAKRLAGGGREETSVEVAKEFFPDADFVVLADAANYPDGLSGGPLAYAKKAPLLLVRQGRETAARDYAAGIANGYIMGGPNSVSAATIRNIFGDSCRILDK